MDDMKKMVKTIMIDYNDEYTDDMTMEEREFKLRMTNFVSVFP